MLSTLVIPWLMWRSIWLFCNARWERIQL